MEEPYTRIAGYISDYGVAQWWYDPSITSHRKCWHAIGGIAKAQCGGIFTSSHCAGVKELVTVGNCSRSTVSAISAGNDLDLVSVNM